MSAETHTEPGGLVSDHVDVATDALTDAIGVVVPGVSSEPSETKEEKGDKDEEEDKK
jgi:hypothetical protein